MKEYTYKKANFRIAGIKTERTDDATAEDFAARALAAIVRVVGDDCRFQVTLTDRETGEVSEVTERAQGVYRILGSQPAKHQCEFCKRSASVSWGKRHACAEHAEYSALVWTLIRRANTALAARLPEYRVNLHHTIDPRKV